MKFDLMSDIFEMEKIMLGSPYDAQWYACTLVFQSLQEYFWSGWPYPHMICFVLHHSSIEVQDLLSFGMKLNQKVVLKSALPKHFPLTDSQSARPDQS